VDYPVDTLDAVYRRILAGAPYLLGSLPADRPSFFPRFELHHHIRPSVVNCVDCGKALLASQLKSAKCLTFESGWSSCTYTTSKCCGRFYSGCWSFDHGRTTQGQCVSDPSKDEFFQVGFVDAFFKKCFRALTIGRCGGQALLQIVRR
jgi:hypothetical protein